MKTIRGVFLFVALAGSAQAEGKGGPTNGLSDTAILRFFGGDVLHGALVGADTGTLSWCRADLLTPLAFRIDRVASVQWPSERRPAILVDHRQVVELSNGDRLHGDLVAIDGATVRLDTWYAGNLELKRDMLRRIANRSPLVAYAGPTSLDDWTVAPYSSPRPRRSGGGGGGEGGGWRYANGAFFMSGSGGGAIGRNIALPDKANIEFDLKWRSPLNLRVGFHVLDADLNSGKGYLLTMNDGSCTLNVLPNRVLGNPVPFTDKTGRKQGHVSIRIDKARRSFALLFNGNPVGEWLDMADFAGGGNGFVFASDVGGRNGAIQISNMIVTPWEELADNKVAARSETEDTVALLNGDRITGELQGLAAGQALIRTEDGDTKLPLDRILRIEMAGRKIIKPRLRPDDVRVTIADGSRCTLRIRGIDARLLRGESENGSAVAVPLDAIRQIRFNPYDFRSTADADDDGNLLNDTW